jgi:hypothetical protein
MRSPRPDLSGRYVLRPFQDRNAESITSLRYSCQSRSRYNISGGGPLMTVCTSIGMFNGTPPGPGAADARAAIA